MTDGETRRVIRELSPPPSAYTESALFTHPGGGAELVCVYERAGAMFRGGLRFSRVRAYRFRSESHCTVWHSEDAYDTLVEIENSAWVAELSAADSAVKPWTMAHYLIFIDGAGAYEVAAEGVEWLPEESA